MLLNDLVSGVLTRRYKRFLADVQLDDGSEITVHCPNTGAMTGCAEAGSRVWLQASANPKRKYRYTWELVEIPEGMTACVHSARANGLVVEALQHGGVPELEGYPLVRREVLFGTEGSRVDLHLSDGVRPDCYVEVKSVTLHLGDGLGAFPDAVSQRGRKHLRELMTMHAQGLRAVLLFVSQHSGITRLAPADRIDPGYGDTLREAIAAGVEVLGYDTIISPTRIILGRRLPVLPRQPC